MASIPLIPPLPKPVEKKPNCYLFIFVSKNSDTSHSFTHKIEAHLYESMEADVLPITMASELIGSSFRNKEYNEECIAEEIRRFVKRYQLSAQILGTTVALDPSCNKF